VSTLPAASLTIGAWRELEETHALLWRLLEEDLAAECAISLVDYEVLVRLSEVPEQRLRLQDLTLPGRMTKSGVSRLVDRLEAAGLIEVQSCPSDRRGAFAVLTDAGRAMERRAAAVHVAGLECHVGECLSPDQLELLRSLLMTVHERLPGRRRNCSG
jgi:DNA-binding MarR family transcriptional regulator